jgi:hypothetical protein
MRRLWIPAAIVAASVFTLAPSALAGAAGNPSPTGTGQPSQSCQGVEGTGGTTPGSAAPNGGAAFSPGSVFNEPQIDSTNGGTGGINYNLGNANSPNTTNAVSQYDVACFQVSS